MNNNMIIFNDMNFKRKKVKREKIKFNYLKASLPWVEKYRPKNTDEILLHPYIKILYSHYAFYFM